MNFFIPKTQDDPSLPTKISNPNDPVKPPEGVRRIKGQLSLSDLTEKIHKVIQNSPDRKVDLSELANILNAPKRRIYDITNVLEGIGYIRKYTKNKIKLIDQ